MSNTEFLLEFHRLQLGITYKELFPYPFGSLCYSVETTEPSENHCTIHRFISADEITTVEKKFEDLERYPSFYFEESPIFASCIDELTQFEYIQDWKDAWLFYPRNEISFTYPETLTVRSEDELQVFLQTFSDCFQEDDPQNPHGSMSDRLDNIHEMWHAHKGSGRLEYFIIYKDKQPVATSALATLNGIGYIDSVGSLQEVRGQGFGKIATNYAVNQSINHGNATHCLCTIEGTYPHEFYKKIGFDHRFSAVGYTKRK